MTITKKDLKALAKELKAYTDQQVKPLARKTNLNPLARKKDLKGLTTRKELNAQTKLIDKRIINLIRDPRSFTYMEMQDRFDEVIDLLEQLQEHQRTTKISQALKTKL